MSKSLFITIFIFFLTINVSKGYEEIKILYKIDDKIITNLDVVNEYKYLISLNNDLGNLEKSESLKIAENSLIREKIKINELKKFVDIENFNDKNLIDKIVKNFYLKLNLNDIQSFKTYLNKFDISLTEVEQKIKIEVLWNQLIVNKFKNQINIDIPELKKKVKKEKMNMKDLVEYELSEIVFQANSQADLQSKVDEINLSINNLGFKTTANKFSISDTAKFGGAVGKINENQLSEEILNKIKNIEIGEYTNPIKVGNGFLILMINKKNLIKSKLNEEEMLKNMVDFETNKQLEQFSLIYFNKIKLNAQIDEL
mgnify:CR=1 FL=1